MSNRSIQLNDAVYDYLLQVSLRETDQLRQLRQETAGIPLASMQIAPEQGQFMALLVQLLGVRRAIEIGVFTGYSALAVALAMPADGRLIACDINETWTTMAREHWQKAGVADKIDLHLAPALETLDTLLQENQAETFDFAFIDADKGGYIEYYERLLQLLRPGGLIAVDNVLWDGAVADPNNTDADTVALRAFNEHLRADERIALSLVPIGDGVTLAMKRS
ncbi:MAG: class I SAM-dependent methyltransferase [Candidatus Competibacteraceae bacterium]|jgi:predicted O-methyltransferase YrrM|nr:class I SAM-dependent methyltransferase [Candidatus Competibacteraceae bacterium]